MCIYTGKLVCFETQIDLKLHFIRQFRWPCEYTVKYAVKLTVINVRYFNVKTKKKNQTKNLPWNQLFEYLLLNLCTILLQINLYEITFEDTFLSQI
jgi:hypothetical protein